MSWDYKGSTTLFVFLKAAVSKAITLFSFFFFFNPKKTHITFSDTVFGEDGSNYCSEFPFCYMLEKCFD